MVLLSRGPVASVRIAAAAAYFVEGAYESRE